MCASTGRVRRFGPMRDYCRTGCFLVTIIVELRYLHPIVYHTKLRIMSFTAVWLKPNHDLENSFFLLLAF